MRNIEEIAAEERAHDRQILETRLKRIFLTLGSGLALWGWILFAQGQMGKGALLVMLSLGCWGLGWGTLGGIRNYSTAFLACLLPSAFGFGLYFLTRLPSFYWGKDPDFWLSVHQGMVGEPAWSPLSYLLGQTACFLLPSSQYSLLPALSSAVLALALFFLVEEYFFQLKNKTILNASLATITGMAVAVSPPFWSSGTSALGLVASIGFLLFLFQKALLSLEEKHWKALWFLLGLLWSVHPLWGLLGLFHHLGFLDQEGRKPTLILPLAAGLSPSLWIVFRAGRIFPSWGGSHPFFEVFKNGSPTLQPDSGAFPSGFLSLGWTTAILAVLSLFLWFLNVFKWRGGGKVHLPVLEFWVWLASGFLGALYYSRSSEILGPTALWFVAGLGGILLKPLEKGLEKRHGTIFSGTALAWMAGAGLAAAFGFSWVPGQGQGRNQPYFPQQHAINLLQTLGKKSLLICADPFDAAACRESRLMEPIALDAIILDERFLNQRWYVSQVITQAPEILFSNIMTPVDEVVKNLVSNNRDLWDIQWDEPSLPPDFKDLKSVPAVLTQEFTGNADASPDPETVQYRYDLTALPDVGNAQGQTGVYFSRYFLGFNELGKYLMAQGRYPAAIHAFERACKLNPSFQEPQTLLSQMYSKQNILEAARLEFEKTVKSEPQKINLLLLQLQEAQNRKDEGGEVAILDEMIRLNSELADAEYQLSRIYGEEGRDKESKAFLESSISLNPKQLEAQMTLGQLMARLGNRLKAEEAFRAVLEIDPQNKKAQVELWKLLNKP